MSRQLNSGEAGCGRQARDRFILITEHKRSTLYGINA